MLNKALKALSSKTYKSFLLRGYVPSGLRFSCSENHSVWLLFMYTQ